MLAKRVCLDRIELRQQPPLPRDNPPELTAVPPWRRHLGARAIHRCPVGLLVVATDPEIAAWCAEPIETGIPGFVLRPPVLGRAAIPIVTDPAEAARRPELAVLSALAHGDGEYGAAIAAAVLPAIQELDDQRGRFYGDLVRNDRARFSINCCIAATGRERNSARRR